MKERDYYVTPKSSAVMRFLWKAAGGDRYLLDQATYSDQIKYMCLGGIVLATGVMAGLAGGYAFYTIFEPKGDALDSIILSTHQWQGVLNLSKEAIRTIQEEKLNFVDQKTVFLSSIFGVLWGLMIFNIDRFIVTSTGKGDGTEKITWDELKGAIPRIIMGLIIAITISKPIEIRMFKSEIDIKLHEEQQKQILKYKENNSKITSPEIKRIDEEINIIDSTKRVLMTNEGVARKDLRDCLMQLGGSCPQNTKLHLQTQKELAEYINETKQQRDSLEKKKQTLQSGKENIDEDSKKIAAGLDGLLERIKILNDPDVAGGSISLFITLLFMAIELTPIFFKLMLTKTPYDYLAENRDDLIKAESGIEVRYDYYKDKSGTERHLVINHEAERMIFEKSKLTEIQKKLTDYALQKYEERERKKIDENLDDYIKIIKKDSSSDSNIQNNNNNSDGGEEIDKNEKDENNDNEKDSSFASNSLNNNKNSETGEEIDKKENDENNDNEKDIA